MLRFNVIAFTHHSIGVDEIGKFHLEQDEVITKMNHLKQQMNLKEIMYVSTCNRVEFIFVAKREVDKAFIAVFLNEFNPDWDDDHIEQLIDGAKFWNGINAVNHLIEVASSLDSMVIGEREIITQMKDSFEFARANDLSGDTIRIVMRQVIETAKRVYTETEIAAKPVSVVSLAYHKLSEFNLPKDARILVIGAGVTNTNMGRFLIKHGFKNFKVYNRSIENAGKLAKLLKGDAFALSDIANHQGGFDIMIICTSAAEAIITPELYSTLLAGDTEKKYVVDLAVPADLHPKVNQEFNVEHISVQYLQTISDQNLAARKSELIKVRQIIYEAVEEFKEIFEMRQIEIKMRTIPERVKEIRTTAINEVFSKELEELDDNSREVIDKILNYMEKKYVSVPMLMAKEMFSKKEQNQ
ncbi:MAG: glutamyl-tRNA reductase [Crocinitomicaceae bacterium]